MPNDSLRLGLKTRLYDRHLSARGRMGPVFGFDLPYEYGGLGREAEYWAARKSAVISDGDFMPRWSLVGPGGLEVLRTVITGKIDRLRPGRLIYALVCRADGDLLDSVTVVRSSADEYLVIADRRELEEHLRRQAAGRPVSVTNVSGRKYFLAVQGPDSGRVVEKLVGFRPDMAYREVKGFDFQGRCGTVSRFGFTGESGFELMVEPEAAAFFWDRALAEGALPCGYLAAEDLRIGAGFISLDRESGNPFENRLGRLVSFDKGDFVGREALRLSLESGLKKVLVWLLLDEIEGGGDSSSPSAGLRLESSLRPFEGAEVRMAGREIGRLSSLGFFWPKRRPLALAYVRPEWAIEGAPCEVASKGLSVRAELLNRPPAA